MNFRKIILLTTFFAVLLTSLFPQNIYLLVLFSIMSWGLLPFRKWWDIGSLLLLLFSVFYTVWVILSGRMQSGFLSISYLITPVAFYRFGQYLMSEFKGETQRYCLILSIGYAYLFNMFVLTVASIATVGIVNNSRVLFGFTMRDESLAATLYGLMASYGIGCIGVVFAKDTKVVVRILSLGLVLLSMLTVVHLINRTGVVILACCLMISLALSYRRQKMKTVIVVMLLLLGTFILVNRGLINGDVLDAYARRNNQKGYDFVTAGGRTELWSDAFKNLCRNPMGWYQKSYAHNLWLDIAKVGGWISLFPFICTTLLFMKNICLLFKKLHSSFSCSIIVLNISLILAASVEPVIEGSMLFFSILLVLWGMTNSLSKQSLNR